ncbi:MAG: hypothetical protein Tsb0010_18440 [Parvularculaceae bacterium]
MNWAEFNWLYFGYGVWAVVWAIFLYFLFQRRWTPPALVFGVANMALVMLTAVAPFRGALDPDYAGFSFLFVRVPPGLGVTAVAGAMALLSLISAIIAVDNRPGRHMYLITAWNGFAAIAMGAPLLSGLATDPTSFAIHLGEYVSIPWHISFAILLGLIVAPFTAAAIWAFGRARADR